MEILLIMSEKEQISQQLYRWHDTDGMTAAGMQVKLN
jgi:hypothetical protein